MTSTRIQTVSHVIKNKIAHAALNEFCLYAMKHEMPCINDLKKGPILKEMKGCEYQCTSTQQTAEAKEFEEVKFTSKDFIKEFFITVIKSVNEIFQCTKTLMSLRIQRIDFLLF